MNFKIIHYPKYETEICLHRDRGEEGEEVVSITAFIIDEDEEEYILETGLRFPSAEMAQRFIQDYSPASGEDWIVEQADSVGIPLI